MNRVLVGLIAGATGTTVINVATNLDMVLRGRAPSHVPDRTVEPIAREVGIVDARDDARDNHRLSGLGAVSGSLTGIAAGVASALVRPKAARIPAPVAGLAVGLGAMALTDASATVAGATDLRSWTPASWLADLIPHALFGWATVLVIDLLDGAA